MKSILVKHIVPGIKKMISQRGWTYIKKDSVSVFLYDFGGFQRGGNGILLHPPRNAVKMEATKGFGKEFQSDCRGEAPKPLGNQKHPGCVVVEMIAGDEYLYRICKLTNNELLRPKMPEL